MRKFIVIAVLLLITLQAHATFTAQDYLDGKTYLGSGNKLLDPLYLFIADSASADTVGKAFFFYIPSTAPSEIEGYLYYSASLDALVLRTASAWVTLEAGGDFASLDEAYNGGNAIDVDGSAVTLTVSDTDNNAALLVVQNDSTNDPDAMNITSAANAGTSVGLQIDCTAGFDIQGTSDSWSVSIAGLFDGEGLTGVTNSQGILFDTNNEIQFGDNSEDVAMVFTSNTVTWATDTSVDQMAFGVVDNLTGIESIIFDVAEASVITQAGTGSGDDLTIQQTASGQDASLILQSTGTSTLDALSLIASVGSIKINSADNLDIDAADDLTLDTAGGIITLTSIGGDITIDSTTKSVIIDGGEAVVDAINIDSATGGLDVDVALSISLKSTENTTDAIEIVATVGGIDITAIGAGAGEDIDIVATGSSVNITATENHAAAIVVQENGGTSGGINVFANQGIGASATTEHDASVQLHSDDGGIGLYTTADLADAIRIETNGGVDEFITINNLQGTGADAITISANAAGGNVNLFSVLGSIKLLAEEDAADALLLQVDGINSTTMRLLATTGTSVTEDAAAIQLTATAGGIQIQSDAAIDGDVIVLRADGGVTNDILIHNDQGTGTDSIDILSDAGGILLAAAKPVSVTNAFELDVVVVPDASPYTVLANNSGQMHFVPDLGQDTTFNLPPEADNLHYTFIYVGAAADAQDWIITSGDDTEQFVGGVVQHDEDGDLTVAYYSNGSTNSKLGILTPESGTKIEMWYDLATTSWYITGTAITATNTGVTFANQ